MGAVCSWDQRQDLPSKFTHGEVAMVVPCLVCPVVPVFGVRVDARKTCFLPLLLG